MDEMELNDDQDPVRYRFGNCFFTLTSKPFFITVAEQAKGFVEKERDSLKKQEKTIEQETQQSEKKMKKLKATLYSKFGDLP